MSRKSKNKGRGYETHIVNVFNEALGTECKRVPNSGGLDIKGDIRNATGTLSDFTIECKKQESPRIWAWLDQARQQVQGDKKWLLVFSKNREEDIVAMSMDTFLSLVKTKETALNFKKIEDNFYYFE